MAIYTIDGKVYDTDNAEIKISFNRMDYEIYSNGSIGTIKSIFKTKKGNWFIEKICGWFKNKRIVGEVITEEKAKELLFHVAPDCYRELFGCIPSALEA